MAILEKPDLERSLHDGIVQRLGIGIILLDRTGGVMRCDALARRCLAAGDPLGARHGRLVAARCTDNRRLQAILLDSLRDDSAAPGPTRAITLTSGQSDLRLFLLVRRLAAPVVDGEDGNGPGAVVHISAPTVLTSAQQGILQQLFDFTPSEAQLAIHLANGMNINEIAAVWGVTRNTLRAHLVRAFQKAGVNQQSALVSLVLRSVAGLV